MRALTVLAVVTMATLHVAHGLEVDVCDREVCKAKALEQCPRPNDLMLGSRFHVREDGLDCYCFCGLPEGRTCTCTEECDQNTACLYQTHVHPEFTQPACVSKCTQHVCPTMHTCEMHEGSPVCVPREYHCDVTAKYQLAASNQQGDRKTFVNDCVRVMTNRELELEGSSLRWTADPGPLI